MSRKLIPASPMSGAALDEKALEVVISFQSGVLREPSAFDIESFFELDLEAVTGGVKPDYRELTPGIHGYTDSDRLECVISQDLADDPDQLFFLRSTMAHECSHAIQHVAQFRQKKAVLRSIHDSEHVSLRLYREDEDQIPLYMNPEWQAWRMAGAMLMPAPTIIKAVTKGYSIPQMVNIFQVNKPFLLTRLRALKILK